VRAALVDVGDALRRVVRVERWIAPGERVAASTTFGLAGETAMRLTYDQFAVAGSRVNVTPPSTDL
jgi:hypothetical protein